MPSQIATRRSARKVVVITGAAGGIGAALVRRFRGDGHCAVLIDRSAEVLREIASDADDVMTIAADVADPASMRAAATAATERFGGVHTLIANAGIGPGGDITSTTDAAWRSTIDVNLTGTFNTVAAFLPALRQASGRRSILVMASVLGVRGARNMLSYGASKAGVIGFVQAAAQEAAVYGITINALAPGPIQTPLLESIAGDTLADLAKQVPMGRLGTPEDIAEAIGFLTGDGASFITGQTLVIDGGLSGRAYWRDRDDHQT